MEVGVCGTLVNVSMEPHCINKQMRKGKFNKRPFLSSKCKPPLAPFLLSQLLLNRCIISQVVLGAYSLQKLS